MKIHFVLGVFLSCLFIVTAAVQGQSALDGFDPNANGTIRAFAVQPDGKILIVGEFTVVKGVTRNHIARLNPDGTLDTSFDPNANHFVFAVALQSDGKILAGGFFRSVSPNGGPAVTRNLIARFNPDGSLDTTFDPNFDSSVFSFVFSIVVQADNKILVGGFFTSSAPNGGPAVTRNNIARFNPDGTLDTAFDPNVSDEIYSIAVQSNGKVLIVGNFSAVSPNGGPGFIRFRIARLNADGTIDTTFFGSGADSEVHTVAVQADGKILVGGLFTSILTNGGAGVTRNRIARLNADGTLDTTFNPNASGSVYSIVMQFDGKILAGGGFTSFSPNGGGAVTRNRIARINVDGTLDAAFNPNASGQVDSIAVQSNGKILVGGVFMSIAGTSRNNIALLETNGSLDKTLDLSATGDGFVDATAVQPDGKIIIGGFFTSILGVPRNNIARLNTDGTLDTAFNPNSNGNVYSIALQADGKIIIGGAFTNIGGQTRNFIARLDATTGEPDSWNPNATSEVYCIVVQPDGKILVGGNFANIGGAPRSRIARFDPMSGALDSWNPSANGQVISIALEADGRILAGGSFTNIGGQTRNFIARLNPVTGTADLSLNITLNSSVIGIVVQQDGMILANGNFTQVNGSAHNRIARFSPSGSQDLTFDPRPSEQVLSMAIQSDGKIVVGGNFHGTNGIGGETRNYIARLNTNGTADEAFNPNANALVNSIVVLPDGKILAGGRFTTIGGQTRNYFARLSNDTAALQNLVVTQTVVTWTRDGASPQLRRVVFEKSTNGVNYTLLGNGTGSLAPFLKSNGDESIFAPTATNWTLTGLNLPTGQNIYIRARGYYRGGYFLGSESITETVKNVFLIGPTAANVSVSGRVFSPKGAGISHATVTLMDSHGHMRTALSNSFGFYRFDDVEVGETYIFSVSSKRYQFATHVLTVNEDIVDLNFSAVP